MTHKNYLAAEFPDDLPALQRLRLEDQVFDEICEDLELLDRDISLFSEEEIASGNGLYLDYQESAQALRQEIVEILHSKGNFVADGS